MATEKKGLLSQLKLEMNIHKPVEQDSTHLLGDIGLVAHVQRVASFFRNIVFKDLLAIVQSLLGMVGASFHGGTGKGRLLIHIKGHILELGAENTTTVGGGSHILHFVLTVIYKIGR